VEELCALARIPAAIALLSMPNHPPGARGGPV